jgi:hypothetical protein
VTAAPRAAYVLLASTLLLVAGQPAMAEQLPNGREAFVVVVDDATMEELLSVAPMRCLASVGGAGLLSDRLPLRQVEPFLIASSGGPFVAIPVRGLSFEDAGTLSGAGGAFRVSKVFDLVDRLRAEIASSSADEILVIVASATPSAAAGSAGDQLSGIVMGRGSPDELVAALGGSGCANVGSLTSDSTRRSGIVTSRDVASSVLTFLAQPSANGDPAGAVIRVAPGPPPFELHERYLAQRRMYVPIGIAAGLYVTIVGCLGILLLAMRARVPARLGRLAGWIAMSVPALAVGLLAAGHLPTLSYATVVPFVVAVTALGTSAFVPLRRLGTLVPPAAIGVAVLAFFALEAALGWTAALTTFHGGSELDGGRFFGLPNAFIGLLIGASLYAAHRMRLEAGFLLILGVGIFAGWPGAGANLGGAISLFAAAGLWLSQRRTGRIGWKGLAVTVVVVALGTALVLLAHRYWTSAPTHITRFEGSTGGIAGIWGTFTDRLLVGWRLIERNPFALVPVLGLLPLLLALLRPPGPIRGQLAGHPEWRDALLVTTLAGFVAYAANDSGSAAAGLAFGLGLGGLLYVSLVEGTWKMVAT